MSGNYLASGNPLCGESEEDVVTFGSDVSDGKIPQYSDFVRAIEVSRLDDRQKVSIVKNLYLAYCYAGSFMEDFRVACLNKIIEIAQSYDKVEGSANFKVAYLLYLSQLNETRNGLKSESKIEIVEAVINKFAGAVNGDEAMAKTCLKKFNEFLRRSPLSIYASND
jgi:hypothetical protein